VRRLADSPAGFFVDEWLTNAVRSAIQQRHVEAGVQELVRDGGEHAVAVGLDRIGWR
jgi:hypothetical protein